MKNSSIVLGVLLIAVLGLVVLFFVVRKTPPTPSPAPSPPTPVPPSPPTPTPSPSPPTPAPSDDEMLDCHALGALFDHYKMTYSQAQTFLSTLGDETGSGGTISKQKVIDFLQKHNINPSKTLNQWQWVCCPPDGPTKMNYFFERGTADPSTLC